MPLNIKNQVALVTGASAGLGAEIVKKLAAEGVNVAINYGSRKSLAEELAKEVETQYGIKTLILQADASKKEGLTELVQATIKEFGQLNIVVSNHGWTRMVNFADLEDLNEDE